MVLDDLQDTHLLSAARSARKSAADVLLSRFHDTTRSLKMWEKTPGALVTDADLASDATIADTLREAGVGGQIISEETPTTLSDDHTIEWLVDPLCGTVPFSTGMPHWGVNIAVRRNGALTAASFATPATGDSIDVARGSTPMHNDQPLIANSPTLTLADSTVGLEVDGKHVWQRLANNGELGWVSEVGQANAFASAAYPIMQVCLGRMAGVVFYHIEPMHIAAGASAAIELGAIASDGYGNDVDWSSNDELPMFVVAWQSIHAELIDAIGRHRSA